MFSGMTCWSLGSEQGGRGLRYDAGTATVIESLKSSETLASEVLAEGTETWFGCFTPFEVLAFSPKGGWEETGTMGFQEAFRLKITPDNKMSTANSTNVSSQTSRSSTVLAYLYLFFYRSTGITSRCSNGLPTM
jgi:hypothetical protein